MLRKIKKINSNSNNKTTVNDGNTDKAIISAHLKPTAGAHVKRLVSIATQLAT